MYNMYKVAEYDVPLSFVLPPPTDGGEGQMSAEEEEARRIAEMGKPILGEHSRLEVVIEESYEFKVLLVYLFSCAALYRLSSFCPLLLFHIYMASVCVDEFSIPDCFTVIRSNKEIKSASSNT